MCPSNRKFLRGLHVHLDLQSAPPVSNRSFAAIAILTVALGVGANTAIFSLLKAVLLTPLPYEQTDRVVMIWGNQDRGETTWLSPREILSYQEQATTFEHVSAYSDADGNLTGGDEPERVRLASITPNLFDTLGVSPLIGRRFDASDVAPGAAQAVILNHGVWTRRFGGATDTSVKRFASMACRARSSG